MPAQARFGGILGEDCREKVPRETCDRVLQGIFASMQTLRAENMCARKGVQMHIQQRKKWQVEESASSSDLASFPETEATEKLDDLFGFML